MINLDINWPILLLNLRTHYRSMSTVAREIGSNEAHLNRLIRGDVQQPKFNTGLKLIDLHYDHLPDMHDKRIINQ